MIDNLSRISFGKYGFLSLLGVCLLSAQIQASVSFTISAERLQDPSGIDMAESGVLVLVADTSGDGFQGASPTAFVTADDHLVGMWDIAAGGGNTPGAFQGTTGAVSFSGDWGGGDPLAIYWFPTLSLPSEAPGEAVPYGMYTNGTQDGTDPWTTPADGTSGHRLIFLTTDAENLQPGGGSSDSADGLASNVTSGTAPADPSGLAAQASPGMITLTWTDASDDETGFRIERSVEGSDVWELVGTVGPGVTTFEDTTVAENTNYLYRVRAVRGPSWSGASASVQVGTATPPGNLVNISTRALVGTVDERMIGGFIIRGGPKRVLVQAQGPELANPPVSLSNTLADPVLSVLDGAGTELMMNDDWEDSQGQEVRDAWGGSLNLMAGSASSALILELQPGNYTAIVEGKDGTTGIALVEVYDIDSEGTGGDLVNISTRALVGTVDERMIGGFIIRGGPKRVLVQAQGPELANPPVSLSNTLADPVLSVLDGAGTELMMNDDWEDSQGQEVRDAWGGSLNLMAGSASSAAILELQPGNYTAIVEGKDGTTGIALVEVYDLD